MSFLVSYKDPHGGVPHAFNVFGIDRYREGAGTKSWKRPTEFFDQTLRRCGFARIPAKQGLQAAQVDFGGQFHRLFH